VIYASLAESPSGGMAMETGIWPFDSGARNFKGERRGGYFYAGNAPIDCVLSLAHTRTHCHGHQYVGGLPGGETFLLPSVFIAGQCK